MKTLGLMVALLAATALNSPVAAHAEQEAATAVSGPVHASAYAEGLYLLHNFEYDRAAAAFKRAQAEDPGNVMAFWGEAMTYNHPLWAYQATDKARAVLAALAPTPAARRAKARTPREAGWIDAVDTLYGEGSKIDRDIAYHDRMMALHEAMPDDIEARTFAALSTLGIAHEGRDTALYMRAAAMLEEAFAAHSDHPGLLHYMIHSYDDPAHAPLGRRAARLYAGIAPDAGHAQHMVSHIYLALGEWPSVEATNVQAMKVADREMAAKGLPKQYCGHYSEWLTYALDQQGKDSQPLIDSCREQAVKQLTTVNDTSVLGGKRRALISWSTIAARHGADTGRLQAAVARFNLTYARLLAARNDADAAAAALAELKREHAVIAEALPREAPDDHESAAWYARAVAQGEAILALAKGDRDKGMAALKAAAEAEAALPEPFGPPLLAKPSFELLGDEYLAMGRSGEAQAAYRRALAATPRRRLSLAGLEATR